MVWSTASEIEPVFRYFLRKRDTDVEQSAQAFTSVYLSRVYKD